MNNDRTHFTLLSSATMISTTTTTIARYLPRTTAAAALKCARPAFTRHINYYSQHISYQRASLSSIPSAGKDGTLSRDALADIIVAEHGLSGAESKRVLTTIFDTIVEVSFTTPRGIEFCFTKATGWPVRHHTCGSYVCARPCQYSLMLALAWRLTRGWVWPHCLWNNEESQQKFGPLDHVRFMMRSF